MKNQKLCLLMKRMVPVFGLFGVISASCLSALAQNSSSTEDIEKLKSIVGQQQKTLEQQQAQIVVLQSALAEQKRMLVDMAQGRTNGATDVEAFELARTSRSRGAC